MPFERRDVEASLIKKGFVKSERDHSFFTYHSIAGGKTSVWTKTSHGTGYKTLGDKLISMMGRQCGLTHGQFKLLIECPMSQEKYQAILVETARISPD